MQVDLARAFRSLALLTAATWLSGCAISESAGSISDSVSSPFEWSSDSSGDGGSAMYREDVERLILAHVQAGGTPATLRRSLADLARQQGVTDWMSDASTLEGVEAGLRASGLDAAERTAYAAELLGGRASRLQLAEGVAH